MTKNFFDTAKNFFDKKFWPPHENPVCAPLIKLTYLSFHVMFLFPKAENIVNYYEFREKQYDFNDVNKMRRLPMAIYNLRDVLSLHL